MRAAVNRLVAGSNPARGLLFLSMRPRNIDVNLHLVVRIDLVIGSCQPVLSTNDAPALSRCVSEPRCQTGLHPVGYSLVVEPQ